MNNTGGPRFRGDEVPGFGGSTVLGFRGSLGVYLVYQLIAVAMTWPLLPGIAHDIPGDLGDPLLNLWILSWGAESVPRLLTGQMSLHDYWNANIFHPEPLALSLSEHLFGQVVQILPIYHLTGNSILCYNLLFLTSFAVSGLGMFLLVRDLVQDEFGPGRWTLAAAFVAGLIYAFVPVRVSQVAHIQSVSSQWMPLALFGLRRFVTTGRIRALAAGSAALLMQNWSCGYYLIYFAPFVVLFVLHQMWTTARWKEWRAWAALAAAAAVVAAGTWPFLALYLEAQRVHGFTRALGEVIPYSADVYAYFTAPEALSVWGRVMRPFARPEGELFAGWVPMALATVALIAVIRQTRGPQPPSDEALTFPRWRWVATRVLAAIIVVQAGILLAIVFTGGFVHSIAGIPLRASNATRVVINVAVSFLLLAMLSPHARRRSAGFLRSPIAFALVLMVLAVWLSLGPFPQTRGARLLVPPLYWAFYEYVPGVEGLRVPARYAMIAAVFLAVAAGSGAAVLARRTRRPAALAAALGGLFLVEAAFVPMPMNVSWGGNDVVPPAHVEPAASAPAVYQHLATMDDARVIAEFPFGDISWELRYVYYSTVHWKRLVNGYSGAFPTGYKTRVALFERVHLHPDEAWRALRDAGTTHVVVHEDAMTPENARVVIDWLTSHFAVEIARFGRDLLFDVDGVFDDGVR